MELLPPVIGGPAKRGRTATHLEGVGHAALCPTHDQMHPGVTLRDERWRFLSATVLLAIAGCGPRITNQNVDVVNKRFEVAEQIGKGVSPKEVESVLGQPKRVEAYTLTLETQKKELEGLRYYYEQDGQRIELHFLDNKLISRVPKLDAKPPTPPVK